jgi:hypothetical protein
MEWLLYGFLGLWGIFFLYLGNKKKSTTNKNDDDFKFLSSSKQTEDVNPATGLTMLDESVDIGGNPYGFNNHD